MNAISRSAWCALFGILSALVAVNVIEHLTHLTCGPKTATAIAVCFGFTAALAAVHWAIGLGWTAVLGISTLHFYLEATDPPVGAVITYDDPSLVALFVGAAFTLALLSLVMGVIIANFQTPARSSG